MRRLLPLSLCVATLTGLPACDQNDGPTTAAEQELFEFRAGPANIPGAEANGDLTLERPDEGESEGQNGGDGGGIDIILFDIVDGVASDRNGIAIQELAGETILAPETGEMLCTTSTSGPFKRLHDSEGTVLYSAMGVWTFDGEPEIAGKSPFQVYFELVSHLRFSFSSDDVIEGFTGSGTTMARTSAPIQFASRWRKLVVASLVDGQCGSQGIE